ncbi:glycosyl hydrolase family 28-related protein [Paracoccus alkanivorans]|uniref:Right-handed parallel beta-helix repeat-containing protein n=1 Tax=Paracoccus alkanivorans TaxID=2116655 RepID=A0A3M0N0V3_9RHOB|nr:glycosyl hydrolase family 28-related protein [Paracoccus alkanivorans]RMC37327.1 right-handed parallel beta-helix repeat-containing protein [Paracoccus alkanivorans]
MSIAITNNILLMPPAFSAGLDTWSSGNGTETDPSWDRARNAGIVPDDRDFGTCLEILKEQSRTRIRYRGDTPMIPGVYLRVSARIKLVAGPACSVRVAGWARDASRKHVSGLNEAGPSVAVEKYGEVVEASAIVGVGSRQGVDMAWGTRPAFGHFGIDLLGANGSVLRIESIRIEDVTPAFVPALIDWVDVLDFGARGDGVTNDRNAFIAADRAAKGGRILVPEGRYHIDGDISINSPIRFRGTLTTPASTRVSFMKSFDFPTYADAFGDETLGLKKALQALFGYTDHVRLNLCGRRVELTEPLVIHELAPRLQAYSNRRVIANGSIMPVPGPAWETGKASSTASYDPADPTALTNVRNIAAIEVGSRVIGTGVGREVFVKSRDLGRSRLELSQPLYGGAGTRSYDFERYRYVFDFSGVAQVDRLNFTDIEFYCKGEASAIMLPPKGELIAIRDCHITGPKDRGITSIGRACQGMLVDRCEFISSETSLPAQDRKSVAINVNANDTKIRNNRFVRFGHFMVAHGGGHIISGNHWFQGDKAESGVRFAGLVLTQNNVQVTVTGNYIDNASIEWTNEHSAYPDFTGNEFSFGGLTITGNTFLASHVAPWFTWLTMKPYGSGHTIHGLTVTNNVFKSFDKIDRIERVDNSIADLDYGRMRNLSFVGNTFNGVETYVANPLLVTHIQNSASRRWTFPAIEGLPFKGRAKSVKSIVMESGLTDSAGLQVAEMPWVQTEIGTGKRQIRLNWSKSLKGRVSIYARMDRPH